MREKKNSRWMPWQYSLFGTRSMFNLKNPKRITSSSSTPLRCPPEAQLMPYRVMTRSGGWEYTFLMLSCRWCGFHSKSEVNSRELCQTWWMPTSSNGYGAGWNQRPKANLPAKVCQWQRLSQWPQTLLVRRCLRTLLHQARKRMSRTSRSSSWSGNKYIFDLFSAI